MMNWLIKTFRKGVCVRAILFGSDKRYRVYYRIPKGRDIKVGEHMFVINDKDFFLSKGIPTYLFNYNNTEPVDPVTPKQTFMTPEDYDVAISAHVARDIFLATGGKLDLAMLGVALAGLTLVAVGLLGYFGYQIISQLQAQIAELREILRLLGGI